MTGAVTQGCNLCNTRRSVIFYNFRLECQQFKKGRIKNCVWLAAFEFEYYHTSLQRLACRFAIPRHCYSVYHIPLSKFTRTVATWYQRAADIWRAFNTMRKTMHSTGMCGPTVSWCWRTCWRRWGGSEALRLYTQKAVGSDSSGGQSH